MVLNNKKIDLSNIYVHTPVTKDWKIRPNSVAFMASNTAASDGNGEQMFQLYKRMIEKIVLLGRNVYLIYHSNIDKTITSNLAECFVDNDKVVFIQDEIPSYDFSKLIGNFEYAISSRYHAIVHAYKEGVPCLTVGWANKYYELLTMFEQEKYLFDVHSIPDLAEIEKAIHEMDFSCQKESYIIKEKVNEVQAVNIFDLIQKRISL